MMAELFLHQGRGTANHHKENYGHHTCIIGHKFNNNNSASEEPPAPYITDTFTIEWWNPHKLVGLYPKAKIVGGISYTGYQKESKLSMVNPS